MSLMFSSASLVHPNPQVPPEALWSNPGGYGTYTMSQLKNLKFIKLQYFKSSASKLPKLCPTGRHYIYNSDEKVNLPPVLEGNTSSVFQAQSMWVCHGMEHL